jgi:hypothetical protein
MTLELPFYRLRPVLERRLAFRSLSSTRLG